MRVLFRNFFRWFLKQNWQFSLGPLLVESVSLLASESHMTSCLWQGLMVVDQWCIGLLCTCKLWVITSLQPSTGMLPCLLTISYALEQDLIALLGTLLYSMCSLGRMGPTHSGKQFHISGGWTPIAIYAENKNIEHVTWPFFAQNSNWVELTLEEAAVGLLGTTWGCVGTAGTTLGMNGNEWELWEEHQEHLAKCMREI
jgi:hypothetical protein